MRHDNLVLARDGGDRARRLMQVTLAKLRIRLLAATLQRVAAQGQDHARHRCSRNSSITAASVGVPASANS